MGELGVRGVEIWHHLLSVWATQLSISERLPCALSWILLIVKLHWLKTESFQHVELIYFPFSLLPLWKPKQRRPEKKKKFNNPSEALLHLGKCFCLVLLLFVLWVHIYPLYLLVLNLQQEIKWSRLETLLAEIIALDFSLLNQTAGYSFLPVISFEG